MKFSVLLSIYSKEAPCNLSQSLSSVFNQTVLANEVILVKDGPLTVELDAIIEEFGARYDNLIVIPIDRNVGLGNALNIGLSHCTHDFVARMDTDDICFPNRFEKQLSIFEEYTDIDLVGSWTKEFIQDKDECIIELSNKRFPETPEEIYQYSKKRCALEHPAVMFKKSSVIAAGGYQHFYLFEDYYLWVRMLVKGCKMYNVQEYLLYFRCNEDSFKRRGGIKYALSELRLIKEFKKLNFISGSEAFFSMCIRFPIRILPNRVRAYFYKTFLRTRE